MTSLVSIPGTVALHIPARGAAAVPMDYGDLRLTLLPADPPERPTDVITITVGTSTFIVAKNSPVQRIRSKNEHPSFVFTPAPPREGAQSIGQIRIDMADSTSPEAWERTEEGCKVLETELKAHGVWEDKVLFVDDEYETDGPVTGPKPTWGESISSTFLGGASFLVSRITGRAPEPTLPTTAPASHAPEAPAARGDAQPADFKTMATDSLTQAGIAARGLGEAAVQVGSALGQQAQKAVEGFRETQVAPSPVAKDGPALPAKDAASPVGAPSGSAATGPLDEPVASSPPTAK